MRKRYPAVSFDLDRTLIFHARDTKRAQVVARLNALGYAATGTGYRSATLLAREFYDVLGYQYAQNPAQLRYDYVRVVLEGVGCADPAVIQEVAAFYQSYDDFSGNFFIPDAARELLQRARAADIRLTALSSNLMAEQRIAHCGLDGIFEEVFCPLYGRPKAALFGLLLERLEIAPGECLHIGDDPILDVLAPRGAGIEAVLFDPHDKYAALAWPARVRSYEELTPWLFIDSQLQPQL
jgi:putative hydrolase of the HAD superfamily